MVADVLNQGANLVTQAINAANTDADKEQIVVAILKDVQESLGAGKWTGGRNIKMSAAADSLKEITEGLNKMPPEQLKAALDNLQRVTFAAIETDTDLRKNNDLQRLSAWLSNRQGQAQADYGTQTAANQALIELQKGGRAGSAEGVSFKGKIAELILGFMEFFNIDTNGRIGTLMREWADASKGYLPAKIALQGIREAKIDLTAPGLTFKPDAQREKAVKAQAQVGETVGQRVGEEARATDKRVAAFSADAGKVTAGGGKPETRVEKGKKGLLREMGLEPAPEPS